MSKIIFANWKKKITTEADAIALAQATDVAGLVLLPPHEFLREVKSVVTHALVGVQDYAPDAWAMGARYALVGHADRRALGDTDTIVAEKLALALLDGVTPIFCIGENRAERDAGEAHGIIKHQLLRGLSRLMQLDIENPTIGIAYEPLWAISNRGNEECSIETALHRIAYIKEQLLHLGYCGVVKYVYGGSVTVKNAEKYIHSNEIDGLLVGAASVEKEELQTIWHLASKS